ncbi:hypothetical protein FRC05_011300 [Tulasnella sp. 425]|nr:hypothetical protein FRC05_011300 [Tulasnella sp. 425]
MTGDESLSFDPPFPNDDDDEEELSAPIKHCPLASRAPAAPLQTNKPRCGVPLDPASQVSGQPGELEDSSALDPQAHGEPNGTGTDPSAQVSGTAPDASSFGAFKLGFASSSTCKPRKPQDSDAALTAQVSGTASKTGFLGNVRVKCKAAAASAKRSRVIVQASLGRIKDAGKLGFKSKKKTEREMEKAYRTWLKGKWRDVDSDSEDVADFFEDDEDIDEGGFSKSEQERTMAESRRGGGLAFYGASTSQDSSRKFSEEEWEELEQFQGVRSGTTAAVQPQPEATPVDLDLDIEAIYKIFLELTEPPQPPPAPANRRSFGSSTKKGWRRVKRVVSGFLC